VTLTGRRLLLETETATGDATAAERVAKNMPIQGTSADITKLALARLRRRLAQHHDAGVVNTVHDEVVVECDAAEAEAIQGALVAEMGRGGHRRAAPDAGQSRPVVSRVWTNEPTTDP